MPVKFLFIVILAAVCGQAIAQDKEITGQIIDSKTGQPVADAHVVAPSDRITVTDSSGHFRLRIDQFPATIRIIHVAYGTSEYRLEEPPMGRIVIRIEQQVTDVGEVQISETRLRNLTRKEDFSLQQFAIDGDIIWMLGSVNNNPNLKRLYLSNLYGDTLASIPAVQAERIFRDVFNTVHLVFRDSVYQLFHPKGNLIRLLYPMERKSFFSLMGDIGLEFGGKLVYGKELPGSHKATVYFVQKDDPVRHQLVVMADTLEADAQRTADKIDGYMYNWNIPELLSIWMTVQRYNKRGTRFDRVIRPPVPYELFKSDSLLYVVNYLKDSLLAYNGEGHLERAIPIDFHKEVSFAGPHYKNLTCLTDPVTQKVFILERRTTGCDVKPLDPQKGTAGPSVPLPDYPGMDGLTVNGNAIYFLYAEKHFPFFNRLYRYQL